MPLYKNVQIHIFLEQIQRNAGFENVNLIMQISLYQNLHHGYNNSKKYIPLFYYKTNVRYVYVHKEHNALLFVYGPVFNFFNESRLW